MRKFIATLLASLFAALAFPVAVFAHVTVSPDKVSVAQRQTFTLSVPNEKTDAAMTSLKLILPDGLHDVMPSVHAGWTITTTKNGDAITSITWEGGGIPAAQRDDFTFRAQVPAKAGELRWKAYQTFVDGSTTSWDQAPTTQDSESSTSGPYSITHVVSDTETTSATGISDPATTQAVVISLAALAVSLVALLRSGRVRS